MNFKTISSLVIGLVVGAGGIFALDATQEACDKLPDTPAAIESSE